MLVLSETVGGGPAGDADAAIRQLYARHAKALRRYAERFRPDGASADDIVQETFIRAWRHLPQLSSGDFPVRPWLYRVARNLLIDADRAARSRPVTVAQAAEEGHDDTGLDRVLDQQLVADALDQLSPAHRTVLVETFYQGRTLAKVAQQLGIPDGTARSRLHYALQALRRQLEASEAIEPPPFSSAPRPDPKPTPPASTPPTSARRRHRRPRDPDSRGESSTPQDAPANERRPLCDATRTTCAPSR